MLKMAFPALLALALAPACTREEPPPEPSPPAIPGEPVLAVPGRTQAPPPPPAFAPPVDDAGPEAGPDDQRDN